MKLNTTHEVVNGTFHVQSGLIQFDRSTTKISGSVVVLAFPTRRTMVNSLMRHPNTFGALMSGAMRMMVSAV
ncbi:MAG: hypothetical protein ACLQBA_17090 [Candidatus Binataceae bacterium]